MAVTQKTLRSAQQNRRVPVALGQRIHSLLYAVALLLAAITIYLAVSQALGWVQVFFDDLRYGRPRTTQLAAFVGHGEASGQPTHLIAVNLSRQVMIIELPGGDPGAARTISGPYLVGANEDLTPLALNLRDYDADGHVDLVLNIRNEQIVYLNKNGMFRVPTPAEQAALLQGKRE